MPPPTDVLRGEVQGFILRGYEALASARYTAAGLVEHFRVDPLHLPGRKEHFGFRDGIAQPVVPCGKEDAADPDGVNTVAVGEVLLGYPNAYDELPPSPIVPDPVDKSP